MLKVNTVNSSLYCKFCFATLHIHSGRKFKVVTTLTVQENICINLLYQGQGIISITANSFMAMPMVFTSNGQSLYAK